MIVCSWVFRRTRTASYRWRRGFGFGFRTGRLFLRRSRPNSGVAGTSSARLLAPNSQERHREILAYVLYWLPDEILAHVIISLFSVARFARQRGTISAIDLSSSFSSFSTASSVSMATTVWLWASIPWDIAGIVSSSMVSIASTNCLVIELQFPVFSWKRLSWTNG